MNNEHVVLITRQMVLWCVVMFIGGQLLQLFWVKIPAVKERCRVANKPFSMKTYWESDWNLIVGTCIFGGMLIVGLGELVTIKPEVLSYIRWFFAFIGFAGSSFVLSKYSKFEKSINAIVDLKTDIADGIKDKTGDVG